MYLIFVSVFVCVSSIPRWFKVDSEIEVYCTGETISCLLYVLYTCQIALHVVGLHVRVLITWQFWCALPARH